MNREIRYRVWHKRRKKYYPVLHLHLDSRHKPWVTAMGFSIIEGKDINIQIQPKDCIIEQYTGLNDESGIMIYEGDLLFGISAPYTVIFCEGNCGFMKQRGESKTSLVLSYLKVIGNIHEVQS